MLYTTQPGIQLYTGNFCRTANPDPGKGGVPMEKGGFCAGDPALPLQPFPPGEFPPQCCGQAICSAPPPPCAFSPARPHPRVRKIVKMMHHAKRLLRQTWIFCDIKKNGIGKSALWIAGSPAFSGYGPDPGIATRCQIPWLCHLRWTSSPEKAPASLSQSKMVPLAVHAKFPEFARGRLPPFGRGWQPELSAPERAAQDADTISMFWTNRAFYP